MEKPLQLILYITGVNLKGPEIGSAAWFNNWTSLFFASKTSFLAARHTSWFHVYSHGPAFVCIIHRLLGMSWIDIASNSPYMHMWFPLRNPGFIDILVKQAALHPFYLRTDVGRLCCSKPIYRMEHSRNLTHAKTIQVHPSPTRSQIMQTKTFQIASKRWKGVSETEPRLDGEIIPSWLFSIGSSRLWKWWSWIFWWFSGLIFVVYSFPTNLWDNTDGWR